MRDLTFEDRTSFLARPLFPFGAEIEGLDLRRQLDEGTAGRLRLALAEFQVLVFRAQALSPAEQSRFSRIFGEPEPSLARRPRGHRVLGQVDVLYLSNEPGSPTREYGMGWHSDGLAAARVPHGVTMLHCVACPTHPEADTAFASQYIAYEAMPAGFRERLDGLHWHLPRIPHSEVPAGRGLAHPLVRSHPVTGRRFVFCAPAARQVRGMSRLESAEILRRVREHQALDHGVLRHSWTVGDVVLWENCATLHSRVAALPFASHGLRAMHRSATAGAFAAIDCEAAEEGEDSECGLAFSAEADHRAAAISQAEFRVGAAGADN
jgi:taurine dioxygenase